MGKVLELLEQNNRKLDLMQAQMDQMRVEQIQMWQQQQDAKNLAMQNQIDELRTLVAGGKIQPPKAVAPSAGSGEVLNFPQKVELYYATGSSQLDASSQFALNEIVDLLARQPNVQVVISGYADKTGSPEKNLLISQKRASVVKAFFVQSGLDARRFWQAQDTQLAEAESAGGGSRALTPMRERCSIDREGRCGVVRPFALCVAPDLRRLPRRTPSTV
jgi:outer membrane protein OmpA-like peptidoglycan-associated protein